MNTVNSLPGVDPVPVNLSGCCGGLMAHDRLVCVRCIALSFHHPSSQYFGVSLQPQAGERHACLASDGLGGIALNRRQMDRVNDDRLACQKRCPRLLVQASIDGLTCLFRIGFGGQAAEFIHVEQRLSLQVAA